MSADLVSRPAWQTEELAEAWIDEEEYQESVDGIHNSIRRSSHSSSSDGSLGRHLPSRTSFDDNGSQLQQRPTPLTYEASQEHSEPETQQIGTFVVREDQPAALVLPITPGKPKKGAIKDIFSPLALERMFEPPSPPDTITSSIPTMADNNHPATPSSTTPAPAPTPSSMLSLPTERNNLVIARATLNRPIRPSKLSQVIGSGSIIEEESEDEKKEVASVDDTSPLLQDDVATPDPAPAHDYATGTCQFTFEMPNPHQTSPGDGVDNCQHPTPPQAQSTPVNNASRMNVFKELQQAIAPPTDPRLRLFQFNYDTYTREHLSALVDSFGANSPSASASTPSSCATAHSIGYTTPLTHKSEKVVATIQDEDADERGLDDFSFMHTRSTKRIKLTPPAEMRIGLSPGKPRIGRLRPKRDILEAMTPMSTTRTRDASFVDHGPEGARRDRAWNDETDTLTDRTRKSTLHSNRTRSATSSESVHSKGSYSSLGYRQQAEDLMAKIKSDMKSTKRLFSEKTDASLLSQVEEESSVEERSFAPSPEAGPVPLSVLPTPRKEVTEDKENKTSPTPPGLQERLIISPRRLSRNFRAPQSKTVTNDQVRPNVPVFTIPSGTQQHPSHHQWIRTADRMRSPNPAFLAPVNACNRTQPPAEPALATGQVGEIVEGNINGNGRITTSTNEDLNRFVSSSTTATTATTTTLTSGSGTSFIKHPGPPPAPSTLNAHTHIVRIGPNDVPELPERVGRMVYDREHMCWVKERNGSGLPGGQNGQNGQAAGGGVAPGSRTTGSGDTEGESEDPFRDIESLREDNSSRKQSRPPTRAENRIPEVLPETSSSGQDVQAVEEPHSHDGDGKSADMDLETVASGSDTELNEEDQHLATFSFDDPAAGVVQVMKGYAETDETTDSDDVDDDSDESVEIDVPQYGDSDIGWEGEDQDQDSEVEFVSDAMASMSFQTHSHSEVHATPARGSVRVGFHAQTRTYVHTPMPRRRAHQQPARSALKSKSVTPASVQTSNSTHPRSVSFSDGRHDGKILGLDEDSDELDSAAIATTTRTSNRTSFVPSVRSKRIAEMLGNLEQPSYGASCTHTPTEIVPRRHSVANFGDATTMPERTLARSQTMRDCLDNASSPRRRRDTTTPRTAVNATFLTECSFRVAQERLVQVITDVYPFEPHWETLSSIDLSGKRLESVARMKEFLPKLDSLYLNENLLSWLSGVSSTVRTLSVASNTLTSLTSFAHLSNLENLDISHNDLDSLDQLNCLRHLRELRADGNKIISLDGLANLDGLLKLSLQGNELREVNFSRHRWTRLEALNLGGNQLQTVAGLGSLTALVILNLDDNVLVSLDVLPNDATVQGYRPSHDQSATADKTRTSPALHKLRVLRLSGNRLTYLDVSPYPNLRTLYIDSNRLAERRGGDDETITERNRPRLMNLHRLTKLENFSARHQRAEGGGESGMHLLSEHIRDVKRLYLSGNPSPFPLVASAHACFNLVYLELAACRLTSLPEKFSAIAPNLRVLNLNYNFLETGAIVRGLAGLKRLRKMTIVGSRMSGTKALIRMLDAMGENIEMLDFRMNPCTLVWYLPLLIQDPIAQSSDRGRGQHGQHHERQQQQKQQQHHDQLHAFATFAPPTSAPTLALTAGGSTTGEESGTGLIPKIGNGAGTVTEAISAVKDVPGEGQNRPTRVRDGAAAAGWGEMDEAGEMREVARGGKGKQRALQTRGHASSSKGKTVRNKPGIVNAASTAVGDHTATRDGQEARVDGDDATVCTDAEMVNTITADVNSKSPRGPTISGTTATVAEATKASAAISQLASASAQATSSSSAPPQNPGSTGSSHQTSYELLDTEFRHSLPERTYAARLAYRGLVMRACPKLQLLDGVRVTEREKAKAEAYLNGVLEGVKEDMMEREKNLLAKVTGLENGNRDGEGEKTEVVAKGRVQEWVEKVEGGGGGAVKVKVKRVHKPEHERERPRLKAVRDPLSRPPRDKEKGKEGRVRDKVSGVHNKDNRVRPLAAPSAEKDKEGARGKEKGNASAIAKAGI